MNNYSNMKQRFELDNIGKRLPYTVPDNFFTKVEECIIERYREDKAVNADEREFRGKLYLKTAFSVAAAILVFAFIGLHIYNKKNMGYSKIENAFCSLDNDDQRFLLEVYNEDIFFNNQN